MKLNHNAPNRKYFRRRKDMWVKQVLGHPTLSPTAKVVGVAISMHLNADSWQAWPSHLRIAKMCSISKRTAERGTKELEGAGLLTISRKANCANRYEMRGGTDGDNDSDSPDDTGVSTAVTVGTDEDVASVPTGMSPEPLIEPLYRTRNGSASSVTLTGVVGVAKERGSGEEERESKPSSDNPT
jgi:Helix-turn-helix domain